MIRISDICKDWWPTAAVVAVILYATWLPSPVGDAGLPSIPGADKWIHAIFGGGLTGALVFDYTRRRPGNACPGPAVLMYMVMSVMAFMAIDEVVQGLLPIGRPSDAMDLLADWGGTVAGALLAPPAVRMVLRGRHLSR